MIRFLHTSDLHLGKPFGGFPEDVRARLRQARQEVIARLATAARGSGASHVLLAGDTFDQETPAPTTIRHALNAMRAAGDLTWILLPGNHDSLGASELWRGLAADRPDNVILATAAAPVDLGGAMLLPAPCPVRHPGRDLTEWMDDAETGGAIRIGLAHGGVHDFRSGEDTGPGPAGVIAPDRAERAGLSYLGLGDWHGRLRIGPATWYSGTPEADSFKPHAPAGALLVAVAAHGAPAEITEVETGHLNWARVGLDLVAGEDGAARHDAALPPLAARAATLADLVVTGRASLGARAELVAALQAAAPDFLWHRADLTGLAVSQDVTDLDRIATGGALRRAAETLAQEAEEGSDEAARRAAQLALARLFEYRMEER
ncbi:MAG: exonuclease SbcCD subunit D [Jhaorihella sp.]